MRSSRDKQWKCILKDTTMVLNEFGQHGHRFGYKKLPYNKFQVWFINEGVPVQFQRMDTPFRRLEMIVNYASRPFLFIVYGAASTDFSVLHTLINEGQCLFHLDSPLYFNIWGKKVWICFRFGINTVLKQINYMYPEKKYSNVVIKKRCWIIGKRTTVSLIAQMFVISFN